jgi:hypothetical protein
MIADQECYARGCACHSPQFGDTDGVLVVRAQPAKALLHELDKLFIHNRSITKDQIAPHMFNLRVALTTETS